MRDEMKKVPRLRFRGFSEDWELCKLGELIESFDSERIPIDSSLRISGQYPYYGATGIIDYIDSYIFDGEYVLLAEDGANIIMRNYPVAYLTQGKFWLNNHAHIMRMVKGDNQFLVQILEKMNYSKYNTGTAQPKLNSNIVKRINLRVPIPEEQQKIGTLFKQLDDTITLHQRKSDQLKELKKAYLQLMFPTKEERVPKLRFADFEGEWELCKLNGILDIIKGTQKSKSELSTNQNNCTPYPVYNGGINPSGYTNIYNRENAITISEGGNSAGFVNFVQEKFFSGGHNYTIVNNVTDTLFLFFYLCSIQEEIMRLRVGTGLPNIQKPTLMNLEIQKTTDNEQKSIGLFLKNIDILISLTQNKLNQLKSLKKSYLQNMFI
ncbi:restriction endonuclease subunit S [Enterococcus faecalis]|uniref:restriction endonuclease subunit S n=1 Tax=Enterococcus faecalis TaxID=1351 RepID=UPI0035CBDE5B